MKAAASARNLLRPRGGHESGKVTYVELFFDLVFVFAVTQLSHLLLHHFSLTGAFETLLLLMPVWWVWVYTSWVTNWVDPQQAPVRLMLFLLMLAGLVLSTSIPEAFESMGLVFAAAYVFMQVGRSLFMLWALRRHDRGNFRNFQRITTWLAVAGAFWIAGGVMEGEARIALWLIGLVIEYTGPSAGFYVPGLGRSTTADWKVEGAHMAERCGLFIIIALGESILVTGATFAELAWSAAEVTAFLSAFAGSVAMWWIYFNFGAETASRSIAHSSDPGRLARLAYTYLHLPLVAGIIVAAVADELVLAHPGGHAGIGALAVTVGSAALYLLGNALFKRTIYGRLPLSHLAGLALLLLLLMLTAAMPVWTPLALSLATTAILIVVAVWETVSLKTPGVLHAVDKAK
ncbi:MAG TPA: low temperature requirement protein A [Dongiaceae bacterium]